MREPWFQSPSTWGRITRARRPCHYVRRALRRTGPLFIALAPAPRDNSSATRNMAIDTMTTRKGRFLLAVFIWIAPMARAQRYRDWRIYRAPDGMAESACVSVTVGVNEKIITKHINTDSISELNGYSITTF